ncbi:MAG: iron-sulfur cluster assembly scaffold protein [Candidatus Heimdallarchaeota archaeon]|nr:iron-sulfur cluster assembly scaffold protein [Candidatus Heimdallarchaeota archaeon]MDH5644563.1 iron-sulfur cluster assembly scaffold protein [Candidatus Heimdallarchaeota archaeon]
MSIYQDQIIDHYKYPRNFISLKNPTLEYGDANPVCGDEIHLYIQLDNQEKVERIGFQGKGCAISMASASLLTELLEEMTISEMKKLTNEDIKEMLGISLTPVRLKCAILCLKVLEGAIHKFEGGEVGKSV